MNASLGFDDEFLQEMLSDFLDESDDILSQLNENLVKLDEWVNALSEGESGRCDDELMNEMFRGAHSLKGLSGMLGLADINALTHKIENIFDASRNDQLMLTGPIVELIFQSIDKLSGMIDCLKDPEAERVDCKQVLESIHDVLKGVGAQREQASQAEAEQSLDLIDTPDTSSTPDPDADAQDVQQQDCALEESAKQLAEMEIMFAEITDEEEPSDKYLSIFIDESEMALDEISETLLVEITEKSIESLMIYCHKIKGSAAAVGLNRAAKLAHFMEDLLQELMQTDGQLTVEMTDAMLRCSDALRGYVEELRASNPQTDTFSGVAHQLLESRKQATSEATEPAEIAPSPSASNNSNSSNNSSEVLANLSPEDRATYIKQTPEGTNAWAVHVQFEADYPLVSLKAELVYDRSIQFGSILHSNPTREELEEMDDLQTLTMVVAVEGDGSEMHRKLQLEGIVQVHCELLAETPESPSLPVESETPASERLVGSTESSSDDTAKTSSPVANTENGSQASSNRSSPLVPKGNSAKPATTGSTKAPTEMAPTTSQQSTASKTASPQKPSSGDRNSSKQASGEAAKKPAETLRVDIERLDQLMNLAGQLVINKARFWQIGEGLKRLTSSKQAANSLANIFGAIDRLDSSVDSSGQANKGHIDSDTIRGHVSRIRADLDQVQREMDNLSQARFMINDLSETVHQLDRVTDGIQKTVMDTRMVPVGPLFRRFKRVIRDITHSNKKDIRLVIRGENTELDKRMIDELGDPLIHMVRNCADHGIELPEARESVGKPRQGTVTLDAFHRGNSIVIEITDDGKGLDSSKIGQKALDKGIVSQIELEKMNPHQVYQLIWEPGLSTAEKVTEVSGRGMGMDIVRTKIEDLNGTIELDSKPGEGTTITIKLPLTLAILPSLLVDIDGDVFAMPVESVSEIVRVEEDALSTVHGLQTATVRDRVVSVINLSNIFSWNQPSRTTTDSHPQEQSLVIIGSDGHEIGLVVDRLLGEEDIVIKSMADNYQNVDGIAGASILGDGRVSLILDIATLLEMSTREGSVPCRNSEPVHGVN